MARGTTNSNARGNTRDRLKRKLWLVINWRSNENALTCRCYRCGVLLTVGTVTIDRIIPGCRGGTYRRNNIRPACAPCNMETGGSTRKNNGRSTSNNHGSRENAGR